MGRRTAEPPISWLMRIKLERPRLISLAAGFTDSSTLPVAGSRRLLNEMLGDVALGQAALRGIHAQRVPLTPGPRLAKR